MVWRYYDNPAQHHRRRMAAHSPPAAALAAFGYLILLGSGNNDTQPLPNSATQLSLPGTFGRVELLEPYAKKKCPNCRHIKKEDVIGLCQVCQSIQSLAKFISRKDFLSFAYHDEYGDSKQDQQRKLVLIVSARNELVRVSSPNLNGDEQKTKDGMVRMAVNDGDIISICWYQTGDNNNSSKELKPLIQFRVVKSSEPANSMLTTNVDVAVQKNTEEASILDGDLKAGNGSDFMRESHLNTNMHNKDEGGMIFRTNDEISKRNEAGRSGDCDENGSQDSSEEEEEEESAPLSLPSKFLASSSKSFSFDSQLHSASPPKSILHAADSCTSSQKRKTPPQTGEATSSSFTRKTPKKSNVTSPNHRGNDGAANKETVPLSSLSYDELLKLRDQSTSSTSLRHNVLSLAVALTSNASAYDSNFLKEIEDFYTPAKVARNQAGNEGSGDKNGDSKNGVGVEAKTKQWMPRLLQGTEIVLSKKKSKSNDKK